MHSAGCLDVPSRSMRFRVRRAIQLLCGSIATLLAASARRRPSVVPRSIARYNTRYSRSESFSALALLPSRAIANGPVPAQLRGRRGNVRATIGHANAPFERGTRNCPALRARRGWVASARPATHDMAGRQAYIFLIIGPRTCSRSRRACQGPVMRSRRVVNCECHRRITALRTLHGFRVIPRPVDRECPRSIGRTR